MRNINTSRPNYKEYTESDIKAAFDDWITASGYRPDRKSWKVDGTRYTARLIHEGYDKAGQSSAIAISARGD